MFWGLNSPQWSAVSLMSIIKFAWWFAFFWTLHSVPLVILYVPELITDNWLGKFPFQILHEFFGLCCSPSQNFRIGGPSRWQRSKRWRPPSLPLIHQKYTYMWNNSNRTPTECWQKTSDFPKGKKLPTYLAMWLTGSWCFGLNLLGGESPVQDMGPLETSQPHVISNGKSSPCLNAKTQLHSMTSKLQCWTPYAKQLARQKHNPTH